MANSPILPNAELVSISVLVNGKEIGDVYLVSGIQVEREVNKISRAKVCIVDGDPNTQEFRASQSDTFVPGAKVEIKAGYDAKLKTIFKGIINRHRIRSFPGSRSELQIFCSDEAIKLTLGCQNRNFGKETDSNAIIKIIKEKGLQATVKSTTPTHTNVLQYDATNWNFILSRAEMNGMIVTTKDGKVEVGPPSVSGEPVLKLTYGADVYSFDMEMNAEDQMVDVTAKAWDINELRIVEEKSQEPGVNKQGNITGKKLAEALSATGLQLQTTAPVDRHALRQWASAQLLKARMSKIKGSLEFQGSDLPYPNMLIELAGFGARFDGNAYIAKVHHHISEGSWVTQVSLGLSPGWFIADTPKINILPASGMLSGIEGLQNGIVKKLEEDPDGATRILVDIPVVEPSGKGVWARMAHFYATNEAGSFFLPEVGDEVVLGFFNNDPRYPVILGMLYSPKKASPFTPEKKNEIKAIITKAQLKMTFDEKNKDIIIETPMGNKVTLSDQKGAVTLEDSNQNKVTLDKAGITLDSAKDVVIRAKNKISLSASAEISLDANADVAISGLNIKNAAQVAFSAEGKAQAELKAAGQTTIKGAMVMIN